MGSLSCLVLGNYEVMKEAFIKQRDNFSGRPHELSLRLFDYETVLVALLGVYNSKQKRVSSTFQTLPGPISLPVVGYLPFIGSPHKTFAELKKKYGPIFRVQMGSLSCLVLGNYEVMKEAFVKQRDNFSGRPHELSFRVYDHETAFIYDEGVNFKHVRFFTIDALKKLGFGRLSLEPSVKVEVQKLIDEFVKYKGEPKTVNHIVELSVGNAICTLLCGKRTDYDNPWLSRLIKTVDELHKTYLHDVALFFPWIQKVPLLKKFTLKNDKIFWKNELWRLWDEKIDEIRNASDSSIGDNFIAAWFAKRKLEEERNDPATTQLYSDFNLRNNLDIFSQAAFETTSTTILWAFYYLMNHPEKQKKVQKEIDDLIQSKGDELSFVDLKFMPYFKAFIQETHRLASIAPLGVFHSAREETVLMGFHIPKRIVTISNLYAIHHDEEDFPDPFAFKPERFITDSGEFIHCEKVVAFSLGKRFCPGEFVAQMEIFNYLTQILRTFDLKFGSETPNCSLEAINTNSLISRPQPFSICFVPRISN